MSEDTRAQVAIITVLPEEFAAVCNHVSDCRRDPGTDDLPNLFGWHLGAIATDDGSGSYRVVIAQCGHAGNKHGALCVSKTIDRWRPRFVFLVGIAGGFPKDNLALGDIVVSDAIWGYDYGKIGEEGFKPRFDLTSRADMAMLAGSLSHSIRKGWIKSILDKRPDGSDPSPKVVPGPIASGDKVVDDPTDAFYVAVQNAWPQVLAVEMEGAGAASAIDLAHSEGRTVSFLMVRGISDLPGGVTANADVRHQWKEHASEVAAAYTASYIAYGLPIGPSKQHHWHDGISTYEPPVVKDSNHFQNLARSKSQYLTRLAISAVLEVQNADGGIPATRQGQESGAWTSASALESLLLSDLVPLSQSRRVSHLLTFLLRSRLTDGGWPLVNSDVASTMATGHAVSALVMARGLGLWPESDIEKAIQSGFAWIKRHRNQDGGWGVEPDSFPDGRETRIASTFYALRPHMLLGTTTSQRYIDEAVKMFMRHQHQVGGWPFISGDNVDDICEVSNTARVLILGMHSSMRDDPRLKTAATYIISQRFQNSWRLSVEGFYADASHAQNVYHNNSPCDAVNALLFVDELEIAQEGLSWLAATQGADGSWELRCPDPTSRNYYKSTTWPTCEFIYTMTLADQRRNHESYD